MLQRAMTSRMVRSIAQRGDGGAGPAPTRAGTMFGPARRGRGAGRGALAGPGCGTMRRHTEPTGGGSMSDVAELYRRAIDLFGAQVHAVKDDQWHLPTPCQIG